MSHASTLLSLDVVAERGDQLGWRRSPAPRRTRALLRLPSRSAATTNCSSASGSVWRDPRAGAGAQLELARLAAAHGDAIGVGERQDRAGALGGDVVEVEACAAAPGDVGGAIARPGDVAPVGAFVVVVPADDAHAQREVGRQLVGAAAQHVALVEERGDDAGQRAVVLAAPRSPSGPGVGAPAGRASLGRVGDRRPSASSAPSIAQQLARPGAALAAAVGR